MSVYTPKPGQDQTVRVVNASGGDLAAHRAVLYDGVQDESVDYAAAGGPMDGVLYGDVADGDAGTMLTEGPPQLVEVDAAVTSGDPLAVSATTGILTAAGVGDVVVAIAREDLGAAGLVRAHLNTGRQPASA
jgi:hypothetical protein